ncbi:MAG: DMT family transporter [Candidatus Latescibacteria bacterium]|nr:DMT family transporter [Candidatus Latescibacterota bacterium]
MNHNQVTGRWYLGLLLALFTSYMWGVLPIILKGLLGYLDPYTLTWFRFTIAALLLLPWVVYRYGWQIFRLSRLGWVLVTLCVLGATSNYVMYLMGLKYISPGSAQVVIQLAPMFMLLGGLVIFKESFALLQWIGFGILVLGIGLFFNPRLSGLVSDYSAYDLGIFWVASSALAAAVYVLAQKKLLHQLAPESIMFYIYLFGGFLLLFSSSPSQGWALTPVQIGLVFLSAMITLVSYVSFATSMKHIEVSRVSMVLALNPLFTVGNMALAAFIFPGFVEPESFNTLSWIGAILVVVGSALGSFKPNQA